MKKVFIVLVSLFAMMAASTGLKAQEVTILLRPGWNWIGYPYPESVDLETAFGDFEPMNNDVIQSFGGYSEYVEGYGWFGEIDEFHPGWGYMYYSSRTNIVSFVFNKPPMPTGTLTVTTGELSNITSTTAACGGSAVSNDGTTILMKGVCWATHPQPTTNDSYTEDGSGPGAFTAEMTELAAETEYYVRAYAVSVKGINYGEELSFTTAPQGILNGLFSVSENNQVCFSQGNLQYQASTNTWRFAENQWDYVGEGNINASSTYDGWIDLYCYGTSDYNHGAVCYQPWSTSTNNGDYQVYGNGTYSLPDQSGKADWGYNPISNGGNMEALWRTMTIGEWDYMLNARSTLSGIRYVKGNVNGFNGWILLPDNWDASWFSLNNANDMGVSFESNIISETEWNTALESNGAVFLPFAGYRYGQSEYDPDRSDYWSSTSDANGETACCFSTIAGGLTSGHWRGEAKAVRLVRPAQANTSYSIEAVPNPTGGETISGAGTYDYYAQVTLTATANEGYTFYQWKENGNVVSTENPYSFVALFDRNLEAVFLENSTYPLLYSYNEGDHTATVTGRWDGVELTGELVIPETVMHNGETYTVTAIGDNAFNGCSNLTLVEFPSSLVSIGGNAFWGCSNLTSVVFPSSLMSIGNEAFRDCSGLTEIVIPNSVTSIGGINPYGGCSSLSQITVESGNAYYDSRDDSHAIIETATNKLVSGSLTTIIPNTVTSIGQNAFYSILVPSITIPESVNHIGPWAIGGINTLSSMTVLAEVPPTLDGCAFCDTDHSVPVYVPCSSIEVYQIASGWSEFTNFVGIDQCSGMVTVTASPEEYGTVTGGGYYENSATCTVTALPNDGYYFLCWMEDGQGVSTEANYTFPVYRDHNLTAIFYATLGDENIINGDFEQGNVGFTSGYYYNYDFDSPGQYYVDNNTHYPGFGHGGTGNFMMIDGAMEPDVIIWTEQISVVPGTSYTLSAWVCSLNPESLALLQFSINGTQIGDVFTAPSQTNTWQQFSAIWYSGDSTSATITILNQNTDGMGNDFGLDDISFRELDPSAGGDHEYVDLGLPSGLLWATCNVGADAPEDYGDYFAWGETQPKDTYNWSTYQYCNGSFNTMTKYCSNSNVGYNGFTDNLTTLLPEDDAATVNWGGAWRMPTYDEWEELYQNTTVTWTTQNGVNGRLFTASNGNSLFLPAAGYRDNSSLHGAGIFGLYWSSSLHTAYSNGAFYFYFYPDDYYISYVARYMGHSVRAVRSGQN